MAPTVDHLVDSDSSCASRDPELTARFINDALPYLNQLNDCARRLTRNAVEAEDVVQETILKAYTGFNSFSEGNDLREWLFGIFTITYLNCLRRAYHHPSEYLTGHITDRQLAAHDLATSRAPQSVELDVAEVRYRQIAESMACCDGLVMSHRHRGCQLLRIPSRSSHGRTSVPGRRRLRGPGGDAGSSVWRWVWPSSFFFVQAQPGNLRLFP
jgi:RNA polymerase sigma-70 factor (ECF subfamily)